MYKVPACIVALCGLALMSFGPALYEWGIFFMLSAIFMIKLGEKE